MKLCTSAAVSCANALSHLDFRRYTLAWAMASFLLRERMFGDRRQKIPRTIKCGIVGSVLVTYFKCDDVDPILSGASNGSRPPLSNRFFEILSKALSYTSLSTLQAECITKKRK
eukprot:scaffold1618_cov158-Pinguiococcus_pyrenoidosus.AAC.4